MARTFSFFLLWLAGSIAAVAVAWAGVNLVNDELVQPAPALHLAVGSGHDDTALRSFASEGADATQPSPDDNTNDNDNDNLGRFGIASTSDVQPAGTSGDAVIGSPTNEDTETAATIGESHSSPGTGNGTGTGAVHTPASNPTPPPAAEVTTTTESRPTADRPTTTPTATPDTTVATGHAPQQTQTLTFHLEGGSASITFTPKTAILSWASPNPGYEVKVDGDGERLKVEFESDEHNSRIDAWWAGGPKYRIREETED